MKTARKPPNKVARTTIFFSVVLTLSPGWSGAEELDHYGILGSLIFAVSYCLRSMVTRLSLEFVLAEEGCVLKRGFGDIFISPVPMKH